jgi:eukaryotic-like serine/threonine-protein kinase
VATQPATASGVFRFGGDFELNVPAYELRSAGTPLKLKPIPLELLIFLVERRGELVTREQIVERIWGKGVFLDTDNSINGAISRIRQVLRDDAAQPRYVQTITGRGYRFIAAVTESLPPPPASDSPPPVEGFIGKKVTHYRILELLGGGGMGVVYKAEDLKLGRRVAIKFLPSELASDAKALARLESEARAASALDHRNICSIYELDEHEGQPFIVMQLLEGQTLQEQMEAAGQRGSTMPLAKMLAIATQVAEGLQVAHEKGFIHRDIKPANIFVTTSGETKVLDFGLAQSLEGDDEESHNSVRHSPAPSDHNFSVHRLRLTVTGTHMGTAFYMSPEQVRGEKLDARTDIFSFGLVLYQMVSGQRAFPGNTTQVVHDGILHNSPIPLRQLNPGLPEKLIVAIDKCLEKEQERRWHSAVELRNALENVRATKRHTAVATRRRRFLYALIVLVGAAAALILPSWRRSMARTAFQAYRMTALTFSGNIKYAVISPDGHYLAYCDGDIGQQSIWVEQLATRSAVRVLGPVSHVLEEGLRFTPDGNYLYYVQADDNTTTETLYRIPVLGGSPEKIVSDVGDYSLVDISPDAKQIVYSHGTGGNDTSKVPDRLFVANADGTDERVLFTLKVNEVVGTPVWSPDGHRIAFGVGEAGGNVDAIAVVSDRGGPERRILRTVRYMSGFAWLPDQSGLILSFRPGPGENFCLWIMSYPEGKLRRLTGDLANYLGTSLTRNGSNLASVQVQTDTMLWVAPASRPSEAMPLREGSTTADGFWGLAWLPDGRLVYSVGDVSELWLVDRDGGHRRQLTHLGQTLTNPSASAGEKIVFSRIDFKTTLMSIWATDATGTAPRQLTRGTVTKYRPDISPDGKWIVYKTINGPEKMVLATGETTRLDPRWGGYPVISPDGRWIAFENADDKIEIVASDGKAAPRFLPFITEPQAPDPAGISETWPIRWTATGDAITYVRTKNGVSNIWTQPVDGSPAKQLTNFTSMVIWNHSWSRDGKYLAMARGNLSRDAVMLTDIR